MSEPAGATQRPRHDWRFLLPRSTLGGDVVVDGDADGTARRLLRASGLYASVDRIEDAAPRPHAVVVRLHDAVGSIEGLDAYVGPDSVVVVEHRRSWTLSGVGRARRRWGQRRQDRYLVAPAHGASRWYAPLSSGAPLRWYLRDRFRADSRATALAIRTAGLLCRLGLVRVLGLAVRDRLVVSSGDTSVAASGPSGLPAAVDAGSTMVLSSAQDAASRAVLAPFGDRAASPAVVVKIAPRPQDNARSAAESVRLQAIVDAGIPGTCLPAVVVDDRLGELFRTTQTVIPGPVGDVVISRALARDEVPTAFLDEVAEWCAGLAAARSGTWNLDADGFGRLVVTPLVPVLREIGADALATRFERLEADARRVEVGPAHFDLTPSNVVRATSGLVAVDWEPPLVSLDDSEVAPVGADFVFFATYWAFQVAGCVTVDDEVAVGSALLDAVFGRSGSASANEPAARAAEAIRRHATAVGIDDDALPHVVALLWTQRLLARRRRVVLADGVPDRDPDHDPDGGPDRDPAEQRLAVPLLARCLDALEAR